MADIDTNSSVFTDVIEVKADDKAFAASLQRLGQIYEEFLGGLGDKGKSLYKVGSFSAAETEVVAIRKSVDELVSHVTLAIETLGSGLASNLGKTNEAVAQTASKQQDVHVKSHEAMTRQRDFARDIDIEQSGYSNRRLDELRRQLLAARDIEIEQEGLVAKTEAEREASAQRQIKLAREIAIEQEGLENKRIAQLEKEASVQDAISRKNLEASARTSSASEKLRRDIDLGIQGAQDTFAEQQEKQAQSLQSQLQSAVAKTEELRERLGLVNLSNDLPAKIEALKTKLAQTKLEAQELQAVINRTGGVGATKENVAAQEKLNATLGKTITLENELAVVQSKHTAQVAANAKANQSLFDKFASGIGGSIVHLVRFMLVWTALQGVIDALAYTIGLPFKQIADGLQLLKSNEQLATELAIPLSQNVEFSKDFATNLRIATETAKELVPLLRDRSLATNIPFDQLNKVFTSLVSSGAGAGVSNLRQMVTLAEGFAVALRTSGRGTLDLQSQISGIVELFSGDLTGKANVFLQQLRLTKSEWEKIRAEGMKYGTLLQLLGPRFEQLTGAALQLEDTQTALAKRVEELFDQLGAKGSEELFSELSAALKQLIDYLVANAPLIIGVLKAINAGAIDAAKSIFKLFTGGTEDGLSKKLLNIALLLTGVEQSIIRVTGQFRILTALAKVPLSSSVSELKLDSYNAEQVKEDVAKDLERIEKVRETLFAVRDGKAEYKSDHSSSNLLDSPFKATPGPDIKKSSLDATKSNFSEQRDQFTRDVDAIRDKYAQLQEANLDLVSSQKRSHKDALEEAKRYTADELNEISILQGAFTSASETARRKAESAGGNSTEEQRKAATLQIENETEAAQDKIIDIFRAAAKNLARLKKDANKEDVALAKEEFTNLLKLRQDANAQELALVKERADSGLLTKSQAHDAEVALIKKDVAIKLAIVDGEISETGEGTERHAQLVNQRKQLETGLTDKLKVETQKRISIRQAEVDATTKFHQAERALDLEAAAAALDLALVLQPSTYFTKAQQDLIASKRESLALTIQDTEATIKAAQARGVQADFIRQLTLDLKKLKIESLDLLTQNLQQIDAKTPNLTFARILKRSAINDAAGEEVKSESFKTGLKNAVDNLIGVDVRDVFNKAKGPIEKLGTAANIAGIALTTMRDIVATYQQGAQQGGVLGGVGAVATSVTDITSKIGGKVGKFLTEIPVIGSFLGAIGPILSIVGNLFTAAARKIAAEVKQSFKNTLDGYNNGTATLAATVAELERQRQEAISKLSGKKGGKKELNELLPDFDAQIKSLKKTQEDIITSFETQLLALQSQSDILGEVAKKWADINKQVKDYIGAGGDAAKATEFLSLQLEDIQKGAAADLAEGQREAIQDAIKLNDLLKQKVDLTEEYNQKVFDLANADAIERRATGSVSRGKQIADLTAEFDQKIANIDAEIDLQTEVVRLEGEVFTIAGDTAELHRLDAKLRIDEINDQIAKWNDLKEIISSITKGPDGLFTGTGVFGRTTNNNIEINVNVGGSNSSPEDIGNAVSDSLSDELARQDRLSL